MSEQFDLKLWLARVQMGSQATNNAISDGAKIIQSETAERWQRVKPRG
jgi:hypothetical protein